MRKLLQSRFSGMEKWWSPNAARLWLGQQIPANFACHVRTQQIVQLQSGLESRLLRGRFRCAGHQSRCKCSWTSGKLWHIHAKTAISHRNSLEFCYALICSGFLLYLHTLRKGTGATCEKCPADSFSDEYSSKECTPCPPGSKAVAGATSVHSCACDVGVLYNRTGSWKLFRTAFCSQVLTVFMKPLIWKACQVACSPCVFLSCPGNVDVQLTRLCWMACAWIAWNVVWSVPPWGPRFTQPRRFQGLPVWAMRAEPTNASQQTDAMPHMPLDWFVMWGSCCFCLRDEGCEILEFSPILRL